jgi:hypothetical protein
MGFLEDLISDVRDAIDDPSVSSKFSDAKIVRHSTMAARKVYKDVMSISANPVVLTHTISIVSGTKSYMLPPHVGEILIIGKYDTDAERWDWRLDQTSRYHPYLPSIRVVGRRIVYDAAPNQGYTLTIVYVPSADFYPHAGSNTFLTANLDQDEFAFAENSASIDYGAPDDREAAYVGALLRVWPTATDAPRIVQERIVTGYELDTSTPKRKATVDHEWSPNLVNSTSYEYEVVPMYMLGIQQVVALGTAMTLCAFSGQDDRRKGLNLEYAAALRTEQLAAAYSTPYGQRMTTDSWNGGSFR